MAVLDALFNVDQYVGPESLSDISFKLICGNLDIISKKNKRGYRTLFKGLALPSEICDRIVEYYVQNNAAEEPDCFFTIFKNLNATKLSRVKVVRCNLTDQSVKIITRHKPVDLELTDCPNLTEESIKHINANSERLCSLVWNGTGRIALSLFMDSNKCGYVFKTPNLKRLALRRVPLPGSGYDVLLAGLTTLTHLDLSGSVDVENFAFYDLVPNLVSLILYNVRLNSNPRAFVTNVCHLKNLRHLDISQFNVRNEKFDNPNGILADLMTGLPRLVSLDIGGTNLAGTGVAERTFESNIDNLIKNELCDIPGLACRTQRPLQFLGLYGTAYGACRRHDIPAKVIAGDANEDQILIAAYVCMDNKPDLLHNVLNDLYHVCRSEKCRRMDQALHMVLEAMEKQPLQKHIQISGSATLFYIVQMKGKGELCGRMRTRIISTLLTGMSTHKNEENMMRNGCLTLSQFRIPQDVMSNYEALVKVLLHSAKHADPEGFVQRSGIYLLNSLACHVEGREKRLLGKLGCVKTMLELVEYKIASGIFDDVLEVAWSTMWNMTDETPINCQRFLDKNGMVLFLKCVKQFPHKEELLRNMMGLLGNVAEVKNLRVHLMQHQYVAVFTNLLHSNSDGIEVPYNAAGILAHMASDGAEAWTLGDPSRDEVLAFMVDAIERWDLTAERNINYRSFGPLLRLLDVYHTRECQHWAVWALANLTYVYPNKYCPLVVKEGGIEKLTALVLDPRPYTRIQELAQLVCLNCSHHGNNSDDVNIGQSPLDGYSWDG